jgi:hypothetical protein
MSEDPFAWWKTHEGQFSNVGFLTKQVFGIPRFQINIKKMFSLAGVLITPRRCHLLQVQNLNQIIVIINNWPDDPCLNYTLNVDLKDYLKTEIGLIKDNDEMMEEANYFQEL